MANERQTNDLRPSPEALLEAARRADGRTGKLKIFVGAAPGVGKTFEMLQNAQAKLKAGIDVVVGAVETHGRAETEALLKGLEVLPRKRIAYRDQTLEEMDIDALIARRPQLALVGDGIAPGKIAPADHPLAATVRGFTFALAEACWFAPAFSQSIRVVAPSKPTRPKTSTAAISSFSRV